jgi:S1-C subfamily serine protease
LAAFTALAADTSSVEFLHDLTVTVRASHSTGTGVIVNHSNVCYVLTAAHVVDDARHVRQVIENGAIKQEVTYEPVIIATRILEDGRQVGRNELVAEVIRYSDPEHGEDLALLRVLKRRLAGPATRFYVETNIVDLGTPLVHVGSLLGENGSGSVTTGIYSQKGRILFNHVFDQTTCAAFPGSSGGGVFLMDGRYVGMIVRGAGETYNLIVPVRRIRIWAARVKADFIFDAAAPFIETAIDDPKGAVSVGGNSNPERE